MLIKNVLLAVCMFLISPFFNSSESYNERESMILYTLMGLTDYLHYSPKSINDDLSMEIFEDYVEVLDQSKRFLLKSEVDKLSLHKRDIDNQINAFELDFFEESNELMRGAITRAKSIYEKVIAAEINIDDSTTYETDGNKKEFSTNYEELYKEWEQLIQYTIIGKMYDLDSEDSDENEVKMEAVKRSKKLYDNWFERLEEVSRAERFDNYVNTIMTQFDPHSSYFSPKEQENFEIQMGNKLEGIGAQLAQDGDFVRVVSVVPGGPAWKGEELAEEDVIIAVQQLDGKEVDISGMRLDDVISMIRGDKGTTVILKVKRTGGITKTIEIVRDEIILEDALAKSAILGIDKEDAEIGYINLPLFYGVIDGGKSCAQDVESEIEKLKKDGVDGIILDLRYNRGGSLPDAIDMTGLFIEKGPVLQVSDNRDNVEVYEDENAHITYDGPLIVLVNSVSASSSEIVAGALQDYKRAVIVGGPKTYGKGTVQGLFDLDRMVKDKGDIKPLGQAKVTVQKFFRVSGKSNQLTGIKPDVIIPDEFYDYDYGEIDNEDALGYSEINSLDYTQNVYKVKKIEELIANSNSRVNSNNKFDSVKKYSSLLEEKKDDTQVYLDYEKYTEDIETVASKIETFEKAFEESTDDMVVKNTTSDLDYINEFDSRKMKNVRFLESLMEDIQLNESLYIMKDMIAVDKRLAQK